MENGLRRAWAGLISSADLDDHMHKVGQGAANAALLQSMLTANRHDEPTNLLIVGGGAAQFLDYVPARTVDRSIQHNIYRYQSEFSRVRARVSCAPVGKMCVLSSTILKSHNSRIGSIWSSWFWFLSILIGNGVCKISTRWRRIFGMS